MKLETSTSLHGHRLPFIMLFLCMSGFPLFGQIWLEGNARGVFQLGGGVGWQCIGGSTRTLCYADLSYSVFDDPLKGIGTVNLGVRIDPSDGTDTRVFGEIVYSPYFCCVGAGGTWGPVSGRGSVHAMAGLLLPFILCGMNINLTGPSESNQCMIFIPIVILFFRVGTESFESVFYEVGFKIKWFLPIGLRY